MQSSEQNDYNIFSALVDTIHKKEQKKLQYVKCPKCSRITPFRLISTEKLSVKCKKCGNNITIKNSN